MASRLEDLLDRLEQHYGPTPAPLSTPFEIVMWENAGYLVSDKRREAILEDMRRRIGMTPGALLEAPRDVLEELASQGGMRPEQRIGKWMRTAALALEPLPADIKKAQKALRRYPGIGAPGAEKILLFCHLQPVLALESNGLRALLRLGYGEEEGDYGTTYRTAQRAAQAELRTEFDMLIRAFQLLRRHGQELCRRTTPACHRCPLAPDCPSAPR